MLTFVFAGLQRCSNKQLDGSITHISFLPLLSSIVVACDSVRSRPTSAPHAPRRRCPSPPPPAAPWWLCSVPATSPSSPAYPYPTQSPPSPPTPRQAPSCSSAQTAALSTCSTAGPPAPLLHQTRNPLSAHPPPSCSHRCLSSYTIAPSFIMGIPASEVEDTPHVVAALPSPADPRVLFAANAAGASSYITSSSSSSSSSITSSLHYPPPLAATLPV